MKSLFILFHLIPAEVECVCIFFYSTSSDYQLQDFLDNGWSQQFLNRFIQPIWIIKLNFEEIMWGGKPSRLKWICQEFLDLVSSFQYNVHSKATLSLQLSPAPTLPHAPDQELNISLKLSCTLSASGFWDYFLLYKTNRTEMIADIFLPPET